jgi:Nucleoside-diphosphate-sugar epimerases
MKVLVTGGTGFIGANLTAALIRHGYSVRVLRRANSSLVALAHLPHEQVIGDILDLSAVTRAVDGCELVFHSAALVSYWRVPRDQLYTVNVEGTRIVMKACLWAGVPRLVYTSSTSAIGIPTPGTIATEKTPFDRRSEVFAYADSKHRAEGEVLSAVEKGLQAVIVNPATVIGPGDHSMNIGRIMIALARHPIPAVPPGGMCVADIEAVVHGHIAAALRGRVGERYILGGENLSYHEIAATVAEMVRRRLPRWVIPSWSLDLLARAVDAFNIVSQRPPILSGEQIRFSGFDLFFDSSKAVRELNYPLMPFRGAVEKAYRWYKENGYLD